MLSNRSINSSQNWDGQWTKARGAFRARHGGSFGNGREGVKRRGDAPFCLGLRVRGRPMSPHGTQKGGLKLLRASAVWAGVELTGQEQPRLDALQGPPLTAVPRDSAGQRAPEAGCWVRAFSV